MKRWPPQLKYLCQTSLVLFSKIACSLCSSLCNQGQTWHRRQVPGPSISRRMASDDDMSGRIVAAAIVSALAGISFTVARIYSNGVLLHRWHRENSIVALACVSPISQSLHLQTANY